ncbi:streptomycin 6-kinase [Friedmanniella luteola]|uniref:Streptomycin 6-kinase n=1 Tax=Friedmanniella luteola TaxID=546871 RepID=A0A1H1LUZ3_9ACTN|nr:aminoglycoside phosphotransferase family protein [Friedmanniella luteola]SDR78237.1 streptomycin 6-kinase [Friedmanniella luteola]
MPPAADRAPVPAVEVPAALAASHRRYFGAAGDRWVAALPGLAAHWLDRWSLTPDGPAASGAVALVLPVRRADGTPAALKVQPVDDETVGEGLALRLWAGRGAVALLEHDEASGTMLLERLDAARNLLSEPDDRTATRLIADLLARFNAVTAPPVLRRLVDVAGATLASVPQALALAADPAERALLGRVAGLLAELLTEPVGDRLLHWDLHHSNVLATLDGAGWRAIDPKPLAGDPGFELLPALWNRWDAVVATGDVPRAVRARFDLMTEVMGLDRGRAAAWTAVRVLQDACWDLTSGRSVTISPPHRAVAQAVLERRPG